MNFMKLIQTFVSTAICVAVLAFAAAVNAQTVTQGIATVVRIQGGARYSSGGSGWLPLSVGKTLGANDVVQTGADSTVDLVLSDKAVRVGMQSGLGSPIGGAINIAGLPVTPLHFGSGQAAPEQNIIRLQADTMLSIDKFSYSQTGADTVSDTELNLTKGKIFGNVKKISAASEFIVKMPTGVAGIRGTAVIFDAEGGATVLQGSAVISEIVNNVPTTITLTAGQSYDPQTQQVVTLSPAAELAAIEAATSIVVSVHATVTIAYTPTASGQDTTVLYISPTSGKRTIVATAGNPPPTVIE
jgi:hypothetical protein